MALKFLRRAPFYQNGAKSGFEMCFGPSTLGAGAKTCLESRIKKFTPHCVCRRSMALKLNGCVRPYLFGLALLMRSAPATGYLLDAVPFPRRFFFLG